MTVVDNYFPFDTGFGATATPARWRLMARLWQGSGVVPGYLNKLQPSLSGKVVTLQTGAVWIDGFYGETSAPKTVGVTSAGMVVARMDPTAREILFMFVPSQTVPTQNLNGIYEIPLMQISGTTTLTGKDIRQFAGASSSTVAKTRYRRVAPYSTSTTGYIYGWDTPVYNLGGGTWAGGTYTVPYGADYLVSAQIGFVCTAANQWVEMWVQHNGVGQSWSPGYAPSAGAWTPCGLTDVVACNTGDTINIFHAYNVNLPNAGLVQAWTNWIEIRALT